MIQKLQASHGVLQNTSRNNTAAQKQAIMEANRQKVKVAQLTQMLRSEREQFVQFQTTTQVYKSL